MVSQLTWVIIGIYFLVFLEFFFIMVLKGRWIKRIYASILIPKEKKEIPKRRKIIVLIYSIIIIIAFIILSSFNIIKGLTERDLALFLIGMGILLSGILSIFLFYYVIELLSYNYIKIPPKPWINFLINSILTVCLLILVYISYINRDIILALISLLLLIGIIKGTRVFKKGGLIWRE